MLQGLRCAVLLVLPLLGYSQIVNNSVTVTASQPVTAQPDHAIFSVTVTSGIDKSLDDIVGALQGSGITAKNFVGISPPQTVSVISGIVSVPPPPQISWSFQLVVPLSNLKDTTAMLAALATSIPQNNSGLTLTFSVQGTQNSSPQASNCNLSDLIANARTQAQQLTSAAGVVPGAIQAITTSTLGCSLAVRFAIGTVIAPSQPNSITVTASLPMAVQPDEISVALSVTSSANAGLNDITTALQQAGISGASFAGVYTSTVYTGSPAVPQSQLSWSFTLTAPIAKIKDTFAGLVAAQQALAKATPPLPLSFYGTGTQTSPQLAESQTCPQSDLFKNAQAMAQQVAAAAGVSVGAVLSLGNGVSQAGAILQPGFVSDYGLVGNFAYSSFLLNAPPPPNCSMTASFQLILQ